MDAESFLPPLDPSKVVLPGSAEEFIDIAQEAMAQAVKRIATARGVDLRDHALVSYGGAAGQHAAGVARRLGITTVLVHPCAAVLSAWGQSLAPREESALKALWLPLDTLWPTLDDTFDAMRAGLPALKHVTRTLSIRYKGTDHALEIHLDESMGLQALKDAFRAEHRARYGFDRAQGTLEVVNVRVRVSDPLPEQIHRVESPFKLGEAKVHGPSRLTSTTTSIWIPQGWSASEREGLLWLEDERPLPPPAPYERTPYAVELWSNRFQSVAEDAGALLERLARSVNIRERRDFSCAIFDARGLLVANAPHVPVHLGAMGETVRDLIEHLDVMPNGHAWVTNDPNAGGSHLPDLTVVTAVWSGAERWFVANRAHHADVGGLSPGSMPPDSRRLDEEGVVLRRVPLVNGEGLVNLKPLLGQCREVDTVLADLEAQVAANAHAAEALRALGPSPLISAWMSHLREVAAEAVFAAVAALDEGSAEDELDGVPMKLHLKRVGQLLCVDFSGSGPMHEANLNAPPAVVRAALLYALRVLVAKAIPLNEGALEPIRLKIPTPSLLHPSADAAVAGGNVENSQRVADLVLRAMNQRASSQGTMNNLTLGGERDGIRWSLYETIGGGSGASPHGPGLSGAQVHMTNTRATDAEVIEARLPLRLRRFSLRKGSGGAGRHSGGDGLIREIELLSEGQACLLATRRKAGAPGLNGGSRGEPGCDSLWIDGEWRHWEGNETTLGAGDRVLIATPGGGGWGIDDPS